MPFIAGPAIGAMSVQIVLLVGGALADWPGLAMPGVVGMWTHLPLSVVLSYMLVLGYMFAREAQQRADALRRVQLEGARIARRAFESRLHAMQARIEPQFLFDTLRHVEELYEADAALAERMLDDLIVYLRAALPRVDDPDSTVGTEVALARAWLDMRKIRMHGRLKVELAVPDDVLDARMPPMVLLPLLDRAGESVAGSLRPAESIAVAVSVANGRLRLSVSDSGRPDASKSADDAYAAIRARLGALYGDQASLAVSSDVLRGTTAIAEVPHERHPGDHR
jgi:LytS/YehU family sensor histidine kinase